MEYCKRHCKNKLFFLCVQVFFNIFLSQIFRKTIAPYRKTGAKHTSGKRQFHHTKQLIYRQNNHSTFAIELLTKSIKP